LTPERLLSSSGEVSWSADLVVFGAEDADGVPHIWRMTTDGRDLRQVTTGSGEGFSALTPDGQTVTFVRPGSTPPFLTQALRGGEPEPVPASALSSSWRLYSPDGRYILGPGFVGGRRSLRDQDLVVVPAAGGDAIWSRSRDALTYFTWAPKGDAIDLTEMMDGVPSLWRVPLAGGEPRRLTRFATTAELRGIAWSRDGTRLYYTTWQPTSRDVVLITNFRPDGKTP